MAKTRTTYNEAYSKPFKEAQQLVVNSLYIPIKLKKESATDKADKSDDKEQESNK